MLRCLTKLASNSRLGPCFCAATAAFLLALGGCANMDLRGQGFADDPMTDLTRRLRNVDEQAESFAFSNKARQIDRNLGSQH